MKLLVLGIGQINFLATLYAEIRKRLPASVIDIVGIRRLSEKRLYDEEKIFNNFFDQSEGTVLGGLTLLLLRKFIFRLTLNRVSNHGFSSFGPFLRMLDRSARIGARFQGYNVYHFHFVSAKNVFPAFFLPRQAKLVVSFWGSDLMRNAENFEHFVVRQALMRANVITIQSAELREMLLTKFGRELSPKVRVNPFLLEEKIFKDLEAISTPQDPARLKAIGLDPDKVNIAVGHNAHEENQHIRVAAELAKLSPDLQSKINVIFPLTYGESNPQKLRKYIDKIHHRLRDTAIAYQVIDRYLDWEELVMLRRHTDVLLHFPVTDALSGAATEAMYAGTIVCTGAWLPYGTFKRAGLKFFEVENVSDIHSLLDHILKDVAEIKRNHASNRENIKRFFNSELIKRTWAEIVSV
jgi:hypothetical protein